MKYLRRFVSVIAAFALSVAAAAAETTVRVGVSARDLGLLDPATGRSTLAGKIKLEFGPNTMGLAVSPDSKTILYSSSILTGADLMLVDGFR